MAAIPPVDGAGVFPPVAPVVPGLVPPAAPAVPPAAAIQPVANDQQFAFNPGAAFTGVLDYTTREGQRYIIWRRHSSRTNYLIVGQKDYSRSCVRWTIEQYNLAGRKVSSQFQETLLMQWLDHSTIW